VTVQIYLCPVCRRAVKPTRGGNIPAHFDSIREDTCPAGGYPFHITLVLTPEFALVAS
jgi:hypothetical protein